MKIAHHQSNNAFWKWPAGLMVLWLASCTASSGLEQCMDIRFYDEGYYLTQGLFRPLSSFLADYSPLYSLFYKFLGLFESDPVRLYYLNYRFWSFLLAVQIWIILWKRSTSWLLAMVWAIASLGSELSLVLWPKVGHLALSMVFIGLWGCYFIKNQRYHALIWIFGLCLLASWVRPEFISGAAASLVLFLVFFFSSHKEARILQTNRWIWLPTIASVACMYVWGLPIGNSGRSLVAFGQHYVHNWRNITGQGAEDLMWDWVNWRTQFSKDFGQSANLLEAFLANPKAFFQHLAYNLTQGVYKGFIYYFETLLPNRWLGAPISYSVALIWIALEWKSKFSGLSQYVQRVQIFHILPLVLGIPAVLAGILFQPRPHYLLPVLPLFLWFVGGLINEYRKHLPNLSFPWTYGLACLFLITWFLPQANSLFRLTENGKKYPSPSPFNFFEPITQKKLSHLLLIQNLKQYPWPKKANIFDASTGATEFLGAQLTQCGKTGFEMNYQQLSHFEHFLTKENIRFIFLHETLRYDRFFHDLAYFQRLRQTPENLGWSKVPIGRAGDSLLVRTK